MKLNKSKILRILELKNKGWSSYKIRKEVSVTEQRVNQIIKEYQTTGLIPVVGLNLGRPPKKVNQEEIRLVRESYDKYLLSASFLEPIIFKEYEKHIPHNKIHKILLKLGYAKSKGEMIPRKRDWVRYERKHSLTAVHLDWHQRPNDGYYVHIVEDDASRAILSLIECDSPTSEQTIKGMKEALKYGKIKEAITDHGCQYTTNKGTEGQFQKFLAEQGIKHILCRIKHPQSNGKVERLFQTYEQHRDKFTNKESFLHWYNEVRPHMSLDISTLETPIHAFKRKIR